MQLRLERRSAGDIIILQCSGRILMGPETTALEAALTEIAHPGARVILEISGVDRLDSLGLGLLVRYVVRLREHGGDLRLAGPLPFLPKLLALTTLHQFIQTFPTEQDAIDSFSTHPPAALVN